MTDLAELLADCDAHGIRLLVAGNGGLTIDAPQDALTPELLERLKTHKAELLALLRPTPDVAPAPPAAKRERPQSRPRLFADAVRQPGVTCRFTMGNRSGGTAADAGGSLIFQFGMEMILDKMNSSR